MRRLFPVDPRESTRLILAVGVGLLVLLALVLRLSVSDFVTEDYTDYLGPWFDHLKANGISGFKDRFSDYNFPYLGLLYLSTLLPLPKMIAIKSIAISFDFLLALSIYLVIRQITADRIRAVLVGVGSLFLPTVFLNSSVWGQSDVIYVAFIVLSLYFLLRSKAYSAWTMFAFAIAFKLQAIFFLPVLAYVWLKRVGPWYAPLIAIPCFFALSVPPVLFGRSLRNTLGVYFNQLGAYPALTVSAPNIYFWVPADLVSVFDRSAVLFAVAIATIMFLYCVLRVGLSAVNLVVVSTLFLVLAPFFLPRMHERYFYGFEVMCLVLAALDARKIFLLAASQFVSYFAYEIYLFGKNIIPWPYLSMIMSIIVCYVFYLAMSRREMMARSNVSDSGMLRVVDKRVSL